MCIIWLILEELKKCCCLNPIKYESTVMYLTSVSPSWNGTKLDYYLEDLGLKLIFISPTPHNMLFGDIVILDIDSSESVEIVNIESIPIQVGMLTAGSFDISHNQWFGEFGQSTLSQTPLHEGDELS